MWCLVCMVRSILRISFLSSTAPGVADLAAAGNWAQEYLAAEAQSKVAASGEGGGSKWASEFLEGQRPAAVPGPALRGPAVMPPSSQWASDYLAQNEHKVW